MGIFSDNFIRPVALSMQVENPLVQTPFWQTGAFVSNPQIRALLTNGQREFIMPFVNGLDSKVEAKYGNTVRTDIGVPRVIGGGSTRARSAFMTEAFLESDLDARMAGQSPLALMAGFIDGFWRSQAEMRAVASLVGMRNAIMVDTALKTEFVTDISGASGRVFDIDAFIDSEASLPAAMRGRGAMVVNAKVRATMRKQQLIEKIRTSDDLPEIEVYNGRAVIESDKGTTTKEGKNISYLLGAGAFVADMVRSPNDLERERVASSGNGSGHSQLWTRSDIVVHPQGWNFTLDAEQLSGGTSNEALSANWADLQQGANWSNNSKAPSGGVRIVVSN